MARIMDSVWCLGVLVIVATAGVKFDSSAKAACGIGCTNTRCLSVAPGPGGTGYVLLRDDCPRDRMTDPQNKLRASGTGDNTLHMSVMATNICAPNATLGLQGTASDCPEPTGMWSETESVCNYECQIETY
jgi:hypothetical protein